MKLCGKRVTANEVAKLIIVETLRRLRADEQIEQILENEILPIEGLKESDIPEIADRVSHHYNRVFDYLNIEVLARKLEIDIEEITYGD